MTRLLKACAGFIPRVENIEGVRAFGRVGRPRAALALQSKFQGLQGFGVGVQPLVLSLWTL